MNYTSLSLSQDHYSKILCGTKELFSRVSTPSPFCAINYLKIWGLCAWFEAVFLLFGSLAMNCLKVHLPVLWKGIGSIQEISRILLILQRIGKKSLFFWKIQNHKTTKFLEHIWNCVMPSQDNSANIYHEGNHHVSLTFEYFWSSESSLKGISTCTT